MELTMLGTGHAGVLECYNTCFLLRGEGGTLLVDGGGGNRLLKQLRLVGVAPGDIHEIFVTHKHLDHIMGIVWMLRVLTSQMAAGRYAGEVRIYAHDEVAGLLRTMAEGLLQPEQIAVLGAQLHIVAVEDGEERKVCGRRMRFFDIQSTKAKQFGFKMWMDDGQTLVCCGDEPCSKAGEAYAEGADWMLHEAFCLKSQAETYKPYEKHHSTAADAAALAQRLGVRNLVLYHTEEENLADRKRLYVAEAASCFKGRVFVPDDLETVAL